MEIFSSLVVHWPFLMFVVVIGVSAQVLKTRVLTVNAAKKHITIFWVRRLFPLVLILIGAITGMLWNGEPYEGIDTLGKKALYFMGASCVSITMFSSFKNWVKKKFDVQKSEEEDRAEEEI